MGRKTFVVCMSVMAVIIGALVWANIWVMREPEPDVVYPMTNQRIVWKGAGYNGIWEK